MPDTYPAEDDRPSPDALLKRATQETRGRLKIFLGAAPGVGKTYEMLQAGRARRRDGRTTERCATSTYPAHSL